MITLIVSSGLDGAARGGLLAARDLSLKTAGYTHKDTQSPTLQAQFGMVVCPDYTEMNIIVADATVIFGRPSSGSSLTKQLCKELEKPYLWLQDYEPVNAHAEFRLWVERNGFTSLNIAGNRESRSKGIGAAVELFLVEVLPLCQRSKERNT